MAGTPDRELLLRLPKAELHCHLDGSVRPETLLDLGRQQGIDLPGKDVASLREYMTVRDAHSLEEYLARFVVTLSVMQRPEALERIAYELVEDARRDGVWYLETRFAPVLNVRGGLTSEDVLEAVLKGLRRGEEEFGVVARVILCALRDRDPGESLDLAGLAVEWRGRGVVGFDLAGPESGNPASRHARAFEHVRSHDMACTCHAGEGDGASSVRDAVDSCCVHRIGHGTRLLEDRSLLDYVNDRRIPIEMCITSNVQTRAAPSYADHPAKRYFDAGLNVSFNTDNRLMSATTLTDEYDHAARFLGFTFDELGVVALNGFESAFIPWKEREALVSRARDEIAKLRGSLTG